MSFKLYLSIIGGLTVIFAASRRLNKSIITTIVALISLAIICVIWCFEEYLLFRLFGMLLRFPRNQRECRENPDQIFQFLINAKLIPSNSTLDKISFLETCVYEKEKNNVNFGIDICWTTQDGTLTNKRYFLKLQSGHSAHPLVQALQTYFEWNISREIDFYTKIAPECPITLPKIYYMDKINIINRKIIVMEYFDLLQDEDIYNVNDVNASLSVIVSMLKNITKVHAKYYNCIENNFSEISWIPARSGVDFWEFIVTLTKDKDIKKVYRAIQKYFKSKPVTLSHGDYRPGNMIINKSKVITCDWEATNITPLLWDFTYCTTLGLKIEELSVQFPRMKSVYLKELSTHMRIDEIKRCFDDHVMLLQVLLLLLNNVVNDASNSFNHSNDSKEVEVWENRVRYTFHSLDKHRISQLLHVPLEIWERL